MWRAVVWIVGFIVVVMVLVGLGTVVHGDARPPARSQGELDLSARGFTRNG